ncbi:MAG: tetratricopeptide repeat protein [Acidobacteriia bacterium]|nr:tetratricopeptide repeat protein [Terriglobia bacterium]
MSRPPKNQRATGDGKPAGSFPALAIVLVTLASVIPYAPVMGGGFAQDDHAIVEQNPLVRGGGIAAIFGTDYWSGGAPGGESALYRPVTILSFAAERGSDGSVDPAGAHRVNIALHALVSLALLFLARRCGASWHLAAAAGLLFAVQPVHSGAVSGLVGRAEVLAALFTIGALLAHTAAGPWGGARRSRLAPAAPYLSGAMVFLALGSKETAIAAPFLLAALDLAFRPPERHRRLEWLGARAFALAPTVVASLAFLALRARALGSAFAVQKPVLADNPLVALHGVERVATALGLAARAAGLMILPLRLTPDYSGPVIPRETGILAPLPLAGVLVLLVLALLALAPALLRPARSAGGPDPFGLLRRSAFAATFCLLPYLVVGNLLVPIGVIFAERLLYLPSAGFCLLVACAAEEVLARSRPTGGARRPIAAALLTLLAAACLGAAVRTSRASAEWRSDERLWEAAVRSTPTSPRAQFTLGKIREEHGRDGEAYELFDRATRLWPYFSSAWYEKGLLLSKRGDLAPAEAAFRKAIDQNPRLEGAVLGLGAALERLGRREDAARALREAAGRLPRSAGIAEALGDVLFRSGRYGEAADAYHRAASLGRPDLAARERAARARAAGA